MGLSKVARLKVGPRSILDERHECPHLLDREPEIPAAPDQRQPANVVVAIAALIAVLASGAREQPDAFIIADGRCIGAGALCERADPVACLPRN